MSGYCLLATAYSLLAITDQWVIGMFFANFLANLLLAIWIGPRVRKSEQMEQTLAEASNKQIENQFNSIRALVAEKFEGVWASVGRINARLSEGDGMFAKLVDRDHLEAMKVVQEFGDLREWMMKNFATKDDLDKVCERMEREAQRRQA